MFSSYIKRSGLLIVCKTKNHSKTEQIRDSTIQNLSMFSIWAPNVICGTETNFFKFGKFPVWKIWDHLILVSKYLEILRQSLICTFMLIFKCVFLFLTMWMPAQPFVCCSKYTTGNFLKSCPGLMKTRYRPVSSRGWGIKWMPVPQVLRLHVTVYQVCYRLSK